MISYCFVCIYSFHDSNSDLFAHIFARMPILLAPHWMTCFDVHIFFFYISYSAFFAWFVINLIQWNQSHNVKNERLNHLVPIGMVRLCWISFLAILQLKNTYSVGWKCHFLSPVFQITRSKILKIFEEKKIKGHLIKESCKQMLLNRKPLCVCLLSAGGSVSCLTVKEAYKCFTHFCLGSEIIIFFFNFFT